MNLAIFQFDFKTMIRNDYDNENVAFDIIGKLLEYGVDHILDEILMMLTISDIAQFSMVNK